MPVVSLPGWLQAVAEVNPLSCAIDGARGYALGRPDPSAVLAAVSVVGATATYRRIDH